MDFGNLIVGDIAQDLIDIENDLLTQKHLLTPNDEVAKSVRLMWRHRIELVIFQGIGYSGSIYNEAAV
jgi:hypothetical protein